MTTRSATKPSHLDDVVQSHPYRAEVTYHGVDPRWPVLKGQLWENDVCIGHFSRGAVRDGYIPPIEFKFYSTQARNRFDDFADCLSIEETIEALI